MFYVHFLLISKSIVVSDGTSWSDSHDDNI